MSPNRTRSRASRARLAITSLVAIAALLVVATGGQAAAHRGGSVHGRDRVAHGAAVQPARAARGASEDQIALPKTRFNPCRLVTLARARSITHGAVASQFDAPLGPTCVYRLRGRRPREITLTIAAERFNAVRREFKRAKRTRIGRTQIICGRLGHDMLFARLSSRRVLNVTARCGVARRFARVALRSLRARRAHARAHARRRRAQAHSRRGR